MVNELDKIIDDLKNQVVRVNSSDLQADLAFMLEIKSKVDSGEQLTYRDLAHILTVIKELLLPLLMNREIDKVKNLLNNVGDVGNEPTCLKSPEIPLEGLEGGRSTEILGNTLGCRETGSNLTLSWLPGGVD